MKESLLDQLIGLTTEDVELLRVLSKTGAVTAAEAALKLSRPGDDLTSQMERLVQRKLLEEHTTTVGGETFKVYLVDPSVHKTLKR